jgi:hypothetical protein
MNEQDIRQRFGNSVAGELYHCRLQYANSEPYSHEHCARIERCARNDHYSHTEPYSTSKGNTIES